MSDLWEGAIGTILAAVIGTAAVVLKPFSEENKLKRKQTKIMKMFVFGDPGTKGMIAKILPAPERMEEAEKDIDEIQAWIAETAELRKANDARWSLNDETLRKIQNGMTNLTSEFTRWRNENTKNGGDGPGFGDSLARIEKALNIEPSAPKETTS